MVAEKSGGNEMSREGSVKGGTTRRICAQDFRDALSNKGVNVRRHEEGGD